MTHLIGHDDAADTGELLPLIRGARVLTAHSVESDTRRAIEQVLDEVDAELAEITIVFFDNSHDADTIAAILDARTGARGIAGTTAGELGALGFTSGGMCAMSLAGDGVRASLEVIPHLDKLSLVPLVNLPETLAKRIGRERHELRPDRHLWLTLVDGLSGRETLLTPFFAHVSPQLGLVGGSLSDRTFESVRLIHHGRVFENAAAFALIEYERPFHTFHATHHKLSEDWFTVTKVGEDGLLLQELDGRCAREVFAETLGIDLDEVDFNATSGHPFGIRFRGRPFPVSILRPMSRGCFQLGAPVHHGERLNLLVAGDLVEESRQAIEGALDKIGGPDKARGMLLFHCLGRFIEAEQRDLIEPLFDAMNQAPLCGFNTFGEQYGAMHINHSVTGVVFG